MGRCTAKINEKGLHFQALGINAVIADDLTYGIVIITILHAKSWLRVI